MAPYLQIPQTPSAKTRFDEQLVDGQADDANPGPDGSVPLSSIHQHRSPSELAAHAEEIARHRRKSASPAAHQQHQQQQHRLETPETFHRISIGSFSDAGVTLPFRVLSPRPDLYVEPAPPGTAPAPWSYSTTSAAGHSFLPPWLHRFWKRNQAVLLVFFAQLFGALMNLAARLLELAGGGDSLHPVQLLFVRMSMTTVASCLYMYYYKVPHFPLGAPAVRGLLVLRGLLGFFGIFGMWYSMMYLPLAEATVITFLAPSVAGYLCHVWLHDPFTRKEQIASLLALVGVILIARPVSLFSALGTSSAGPAAASAGAPGTDNTTATTVAAGVARAVEAVAAVAANVTEAAASGASASGAGSEHVAPAQRLLAIGVALLGVAGGACTFATIRAIGTRAHPLISVNYFSTWCTILTGTVLTVAPMLDIGQPALRFAAPRHLHQWLLLLFICVCGFCTQFMATMGLGLERSNRATAMVYTHMLFAASFDKFVFGHEMGLWSLVGCGLIIGSALWAALSKKPGPDKSTSGGGNANINATAAPAAADIEIGVLEPDDDDEEMDEVPATRPRYGADASEAHDVRESVPMLAAEDEDDEDDEEDQETGESRSRQ